MWVWSFETIEDLRLALLAFKFIEDFEWLLFRETVEQAHEADLVGEAELVVRASATMDLLKIHRVEGRPLGELVTAECHLS